MEESFVSIKICSIALEEFKIKRSYNWNGIVLPACKRGELFSFVVINDHTDMRVVAVDHWSEHSERTPINIPADVIVRDFFATEQLRDKGAFVPAGAEPTDAELTQAHATRRAYLEKCVIDGDTEYSKSKRIDNIPGEWKRCAAELGVVREWAFTAPAPTFECPACGEILRQGVAICKSCSAILDREKAAKYGLLEKEPIASVSGQQKGK
jgi:hypothetical protein